MSPIQQIFLGAGKGIPKPNFDYASEVDDLEGSGLTATENAIVAADPHNENRYAINFTDDDGSKRGYIRIITRTDTSLTLSPRYDASDTGNTGAGTIVFDPSNSGKIIYVYSSGCKGRVISFSGSAGSESFSRSSEFNISNIGWSKNHGTRMVPMGSTGRYVIPLKKSDTAYLRIITASSSAITSRDSAGGSDAISLTSPTYDPPQIAIDPTDSTKGMMCTVKNASYPDGEKLIVRALTFSGSGTSATVSVGAETDLTPSILSGRGYTGANGWQQLVACGAGKYVAFARGGDSPHNKKIVGVAFDYDGSSYTLGSATYAPQNITTTLDPGPDWVASNRGGNIIGLVGVYGDSSTQNPSNPVYATVCTRSDDRTLSYTDVTAVGNEDNNKQFTRWTAQGHDDANTHLAVYSNNANGSNKDSISGVLWQAGGE